MGEGPTQRGPPRAHPEQNRLGRGASRVQPTQGGAHSERSSSGRGWGVARPAGRRKTLDRELLVLTHEIPQPLDPTLRGLQHGGRAAVVLQLEHTGRLRRTQAAADLRAVGGAQCAGHQPPQFTFGVGGVRSREACESGRPRVNSGVPELGGAFPGAPTHFPCFSPNPGRYEMPVHAHLRDSAKSPLPPIRFLATAFQPRAKPFAPAVP